MSGHDYYRAFLYAIIHGESDDPQMRKLLIQPAFAVYRNTIFKGAVDALAANYPAVRRLVGEAWFQAAALAYAREHMPGDACLIAYGREFPAFLSAAQAASDLPYLPGVAALDRCWSESHLAADDAPLDTATLHTALVAGQDVHLVLHAAARWRWDQAYPIYSIWNTNRDPDADPALQPEWCGEGALLTRPDNKVLWRRISPGACVFLDACNVGTSVSAAAAQAIGGEPGLDVAAMLSQLLQAGAFTSFH